MTAIRRAFLFWAFLPLLMVSVSAQESNAVSFEEYLRESTVSKDVLDTFLDPKKLSWAQFDPEVGYVLGNYLPRDGIDGSSTISTVQPDGARTAHLYVKRKGRINTYGNSFTQSQQVNDGETWQEYLAAHLGEPIRNFGVGGFGVYQAYRRMLREEQTDRGAEYVILYIWGDDHIRSLLRCRHAAVFKWSEHAGGTMFSSNFWANVEMDLDSGQIVERPNRLPTRESLYRMIDPDWMYQNLKDDLALQMLSFSGGAIRDVDWPEVERLAEALRLPPIDRENPKEAVKTVLDSYSFAATRYILKRARAFTEREGKKLLVVLFDPSRVMRELIESGTRYDQEIVHFLEENNFSYFDMNLEHAEDFKFFNLSFQEYRRRYFHGHYNPAGNHFFAFSIKDTIVQWLDPKPITYQDKTEAFGNFADYVP